MTYLIMQILLCLLIAFLLGCLLGWWLGRRRLEQSLEDAERTWRGRLDDCRQQLAAGKAEVERLSEANGACEESLAAAKAELSECQDELARGGGVGSSGTSDGDAGEADGGNEGVATVAVEPESDSVWGTMAKASFADMDALDEDDGDDDAEGASPAGAVAAGLVGLAASEATADEDEPEATAEADEPPASDDLTRIEGIGPKIAGLLNAAGIHTWAQLAEAEVATLQKVLDEAGPRYRIHDPATWPQQAGLAAAGSWDKLEELQDRLKGGREG